MEKLKQATSDQGINEQHNHGPMEKLNQATGEQQNHDPMEKLNQATIEQHNHGSMEKLKQGTSEQHNHGPKEKLKRTFKSSKDALKESIRSKKMFDSDVPHSSQDDGEEDSDDEEEDSDDEEGRVKRQVDQEGDRAKQLDSTKHGNNTNETNHSEQHNHDSREQHNHGPMEKLKGAYKSSKDALKENIRSMVVDENQILLEEIVASAHGRSKKMFDSDVPNGSRDDKEDDGDDEEESDDDDEEDSDDEGGRAKRQVDQEDIRHALCKDKNAGEFFRLVA